MDRIIKAHSVGTRSMEREFWLTRKGFITWASLKIIKLKETESTLNRILPIRGRSSKTCNLALANS